MRVCSQCGIEKELTEFARDKYKKHGRRYKCKDCSNSDFRAKRAEDPEKHQQKCRDWYWSDPEKARKRGRDSVEKWRHANKQTSRDRSREWRKNNPEKFKAQQLAYRRRVKDAAGSRLVTASWLKSIKDLPCYYCGTNDPWDVFHIDHRTPVSRGGDNHWTNLVRACEPCNLSKGPMTEQEFRNIRRNR